MNQQRVFLIVLDGLGVGGAPDAAEFGDAGSDTLGNLAKFERLRLPVLSRLGLGNLYRPALPGLPHASQPQAHYCRLTELSAGKDTTTGHWEMMGIVRQTFSRTFSDGFPADFMQEFSRRTGRGWLGNRPASGTVIIQELGAEHQATGKLIVYTSADSVLQVAAHVDIVPLEELYAACRTAREMLTGDIEVDRVIARPFAGSMEKGFVRTPDRRDFSLAPPVPTCLDTIKAAGLDSIGIGKISDIFAGCGITRSYPDHGNAELTARMTELARDAGWAGLAFCNLIDFDMLFGHRNDTQGYAAALETFDGWLGSFLVDLADGDLCLITADHGNDPTTSSTDHSREQVPLLAITRDSMEGRGKELQPPPGFIHVGASVLGWLDLEVRQGANLLGQVERA